MEPINADDLKTTSEEPSSMLTHKGCVTIFRWKLRDMQLRLKRIGGEAEGEADVIGGWLEKSRGNL